LISYLALLVHLDLATLVSRVVLNLSFASLTTTERSLAFRYFAFILHIWRSWTPKILPWTPGDYGPLVGNHWDSPFNRKFRKWLVF